MKHAMIIAAGTVLAASPALAQVQSFGGGCSGTTSTVPTIGVTGQPVQGQTFRVDLTGAADGLFQLLLSNNNQDWLGLPLPLALDPFGIPGCELWIDLDPFMSSTVPVQPDGTGSLEIQGWMPGVTIYMQAASISAEGIALTGGLALTPQAPPPAEEIDDFEPKTGAVGTAVSIAGAGFDTQTYAAEDVLVLGDGVGGFFGRATEVLQTGVEAEIIHTAKYALDQPVTVSFGKGHTGIFPNFGKIKFSEPARGWRRLASEPEAISSQPFAAQSENLYQGCGDPDYHVNLKFELDAGELKLRLPSSSSAGLCQGDTLALMMYFGTDDGEKYFAELPLSDPLQGLSSELLWTVLGPELAGELEAVMNLATVANPFLASYDLQTNEISITSQAGTINYLHQESILKIAFDPDHHTVFTEQAGEIDNFVGIESSSPSPAFDSYVTAISPSQSKREYDQSGINSSLRETLDNFGVGRARSARYEVRLHGDGSQTYTDHISLGWDELGPPTGESLVYQIRLEDLPNTGYKWTPGQQTTLCFDLSALPRKDGSTVSILDELEDGVLDVRIDDDTSVDYMILKVLRCTN